MCPFVNKNIQTTIFFFKFWQRNSGSDLHQDPCLAVLCGLQLNHLYPDEYCRRMNLAGFWFVLCVVWLDAGEVTLLDILTSKPINVELINEIKIPTQSPQRRCMSVWRLGGYLTHSCRDSSGSCGWLRECLSCICWVARA